MSTLAAVTVVPVSLPGMARSVGFHPSSFAPPTAPHTAAHPGVHWGWPPTIPSQHRDDKGMNFAASKDPSAPRGLDSTTACWDNPYGNLSMFYVPPSHPGTFSTAPPPTGISSKHRKSPTKHHHRLSGDVRTRTLSDASIPQKPLERNVNRASGRRGMASQSREATSPPMTKANASGPDTFGGESLSSVLEAAKTVGAESVTYWPPNPSAVKGHSARFKIGISRGGSRQTSHADTCGGPPSQWGGPPKWEESVY